MIATRSHDLHPVVRRFIQDAGNLTQSFGIGRVTGQLYAYLYFSPEPRNLADMQSALGISKGSASMTVRQLEQWGGVRKVWVHGDRKDYYEAVDWLGGLLRSAAADLLGRKLSDTSSLLDDAEQSLADPDLPDRAFIQQRVGKLRSFQGKVKRVLANPLVRQLLK